MDNYTRDRVQSELTQAIDNMRETHGSDKVAEMKDAARYVLEQVDKRGAEALLSDAMAGKLDSWLPPDRKKTGADPKAVYDPADTRGDDASVPAPGATQTRVQATQDQPPDDSPQPGATPLVDAQGQPTSGHAERGIDR